MLSIAGRPTWACLPVTFSLNFGVSYMAGKIVPTTLMDLLERGDAAHPAIRVPDGPTVTYDSLRHQVNSLAEQLQGRGIGRGDRVAIVLPNGIEAIVCFLAVSSVATAAPLNSAYKEDEFRFYLEDTNARALITPPGGGEDARTAAPAGALQLVAGLEADGRVVLTGPAGGATPSGVGPAGPDDVALVLHTSGTTSRPKRVPLAHRNLAVSVCNVAETYQLTSKDVSLCVMPLFHVHGLVASTLATLFTGGTVLVPPRFNALNFWQVAEACGATWYSAVPSIHQALLTRAKSRETGRPGPGSRMRFIRSCSSALPPNTMLEMEEQFGVPVLEAYGMTEAAHQMASNPLPEGKRVPGSVGVGTGVDIGIMDDGGALQPVGSRGEVVIRGPNVIQGYEDNPEANATSFTAGWFRTGDEGVLDSEGYLKLVGRLKELINRSGEKIAPQEIDEVLLAHPAVAEAVAFGVPNSTHGEEPSAAVVLGSKATQAELVAHCRAYLAAFKCPRVIHIVDAIPRTATGKVQRRLVAEYVAGDKVTG